MNASERERLAKLDSEMGVIDPCLLQYELATNAHARISAPERRIAAKQETFRDAQRLIRENYSRGDFSITEIASELCITERHLQRIFKSQGICYRDALRNARIEQAKDLLSRSSLPINEIAARVGYSYPMHFSKAFKLVTGSSPREWRSKHSER